MSRSPNRLDVIVQLRHGFLSRFHTIRRLRGAEASGKKGLFKDRLPALYKHVEAYETIGHYFKFLSQERIRPSDFFQVSEPVSTLEDALSDGSQRSRGGFLKQMKHFYEWLSDVCLATGCSRGRTSVYAVARLKCESVRSMRLCVTHDGCLRLG